MIILKIQRILRSETFPTEFQHKDDTGTYPKWTSNKETPWYWGIMQSSLMPFCLLLISKLQNSVLLLGEGLITYLMLYIIGDMSTRA